MMRELDISRIRREFSRFCRYLRGKYKSKREGESIILSCVFEYPISIDVELAKRMTEETSWIDIKGRSWHPELPRTSSILIEGNLISLELPWGCLLYTSPSPRDLSTSRMPSSA